MKEASYLRLCREGELAERAQQAVSLLESCTLCPRACGVNRLEGETGYCRTGRHARVASYGAHFGEEEPLVGRHGSGTIFLSSCNLLCIFCQNREISHLNEGRETDAEGLAAMMVELAENGCHNINFVTPTHVVPQLLEALVSAVAQGLRVPLVYNSGGYDRAPTLSLLEGVFDIYMPDFKFWESRWAQRYCGAPDYREAAAEALREMHRQVGDLCVDEQGVARRGLLVRHLVMPNGVAGTASVMDFLAREIGVRTYVNLMDQYRPCGEAYRDPLIDRRLTAQDYREARESALKAGMTRLDRRERLRVLWG